MFAYIVRLCSSCRKQLSKRAAAGIAAITRRPAPANISDYVARLVGRFKKLRLTRPGGTFSLCSKPMPSLEMSLANALMVFLSAAFHEMVTGSKNGYRCCNRLLDSALKTSTHKDIHCRIDNLSNFPPLRYQSAGRAAPRHLNRNPLRLITPPRKTDLKQAGVERQSV